MRESRDKIERRSEPAAKQAADLTRQPFLFRKKKKQK